MNLAHDTGTMMRKHFSSSRGEELIEVNEVMLGKVLGEVVELALAELIVQTIADAINNEGGRTICQWPKVLLAQRR